MKTRIYATPAIKGLKSIPILKILTIYNGRRHKRIQMKQKELPETFQIEKYPFFSSFIYLYYRTLRELTPQDPLTPPPLSGSARGKNPCLESRVYLEGREFLQIHRHRYRW